MLMPQSASNNAEFDLYRSLFATSNSPTCILTPTGLIDQINPACCTLLSIDQEKTSQADSSLFLPPQSFLSMQQQLLAGQPYHLTYEYERRDGRLLQLEISATGFISAQNILTQIVLQFADQTETHRQEQQIKHFQRMFNQSNDAFFMIDTASSRLLDANRRACEHYGYSHEEMCQLTLLDLNPNYRSLSDWHTKVAQFNKEQANVFETTHITRKGERFPVEISYQVVQEHDQSCLITVLRDISERKAAEAEQRRSQEQWRKTFDSSRDIITIQNLDHDILECNSAATELFGLSREQCQQKKCYELFAGLKQPCPECMKQREGGQITPCNYELHHAALNKTFSISFNPIFNPDGSVSGIAHFAQDITEKRRLKEQLHHAQKMESLGTLAGGIAHDFNNILAAIMGYAQLAQGYNQDNPRMSKALEQILRGGSRAAELVKHILTFSRKTVHSRSTIKIQDIIEEVVALLRSSLPPSIRIEQDLQQDCQMIIADSAKIHQVLMNLCTNAFHAMQGMDNGLLQISLREKELTGDEVVSDQSVKSGRYLEMSVRDNGHGMKKETREKIFEPYFTTKEHGEGSGLGLAVVHGIVHAINGHINVSSQPGSGTEFKIYLPTEQQSTVAIPHEGQLANLSSIPPRGNEHILIVDNEEAITTLQQLLLEKHGYRTTITTSGSEALELVQKRPGYYDLILTDFSMPGMNGVSLAEKVLKMTPELPIIMSSGYCKNKDQVAALQVGVRVFLRKPVDNAKLLRTIRTALDDSSDSSAPVYSRRNSGN